MKAVALDNAGGSLSRIGWGRGRGRALAFAYAALADFSSAVEAGGAEPGAWAPFGPPKAPPPSSSWDSGVELLQSWWSQAQVAARMVWAAAGGMRAQRPGLPSAWPQLLRLPGGPPMPHKCR